MVIRDVCPRCQSPQLKKNGHTHTGKQNHHCHDCGRQFVQYYEQYLISDEKRGLIERLLVERIGGSRSCFSGLRVAKWPMPCSRPVRRTLDERDRLVERRPARTDVRHGGVLVPDRHATEVDELRRG